MAKNYSVDDILEEVRRKKSGAAQQAPPSYSDSGSSAWGEAPRRAEAQEPDTWQEAPARRRQPQAAEPPAEERPFARLGQERRAWGDFEAEEPRPQARQAAPGRSREEWNPYSEPMVRSGSHINTAGLADFFSHTEEEDPKEAKKRAKREKKAARKPRRGRQESAAPQQEEEADYTPFRGESLAGSWKEAPAPDRQDRFSFGMEQEEKEEFSFGGRPFGGEEPRFEPRGSREAFRPQRPAREESSPRDEEAPRWQRPFSEEEGPDFGGAFRQESLPQEEENPFRSRFLARQGMTEPEGEAGTPAARQEEAEPEEPARTFHFSQAAAAKPWEEEEDLARTRMIPPQGGEDRVARQTAQIHQAILEDEDEEEPQGEIDDFTSQKEAPAIEEDLLRQKRRLGLRFWLNLALLAVLLYLAFALNIQAMPLPDFMLPETSMRMFLGVNLGLFAILMLLNGTVLVEGVKSLIIRDAGTDAPAAVAMIASLMQGVALVISPDQVADLALPFYFAPVALVLLFNSMGKNMMLGRILRNFRFLAGEGRKKAVSLVGSPALADELGRGLEGGARKVAYSAPAGFLTQFLESSYSDEYDENINRTTAPICLIASLVVSVIAGILSGDVFTGLTSFAAISCICAPLTLTLVGNGPLNKASKVLVKKGLMISGHDAVEEYHDVDAVVLKAADLFPGGCITLHGLKAFEQNRIDEAIVDAASVICSCGSELKDVFLSVIGGNQALLKKVDHVVYEDMMGLSAWVDGKRVLVGSRDLMMHHGIATPSADYEAKFKKEDRQLLYLANSGELTAMFILSYHPADSMYRALRHLAKRQIGLIVKATDPNLNAKTIGEIYDYPAYCIKVLSSQLHEEYERMTAERKTAPCRIAYTSDNAVPLLWSVRAAAKLKRNIGTATILQLVGLGVGYAVITFFSIIQSISVISFSAMLLFQLFFFVVIHLLALSRKV